MSKEFEVIQLQALKALSIYTMVVLLGGLFIATIVEGLRQHLGGDTTNATILYIVGLAAMVGSAYVYKKGKQIIAM
ncbi:MAG TPA: hypothetical protein VJH23_05610 [archaeon]|nr:hypothetical protein [archaeon]